MLIVVSNSFNAWRKSIRRLLFRVKMMIAGDIVGQFSEKHS